MDEIEDEGFDAEDILQQWAQEAGDVLPPGQNNDPDDWEPV